MNSQDLSHSNSGRGSRLKGRLFLGIALGLIVVVIAVWWIVGTIAKQKIEAELSRLDLGNPQINHVSLGFDGIHAQQIQFLSASDTELSVESIKIEHPIWELILGTSTYQSIRINGPRMRYSISNAAASTGFDLRDLNLPAETLTIKNGQIEIVDASQSLLIQQIDASITSDPPNQIQIKSQVGKILGTSWDIAGTVDLQNETIELKGESTGGVILSETLANAPRVVDGLEDVIRFESDLAKSNVTLNYSKTDGANLWGRFQLQNMKANLVAFELPLSADIVDISVDENRVQIFDFSATTDGNDAIKGDVIILLDQSPLKIDFNGNFQSVAVATLNKGVLEIPSEVSGNGNGQYVGGVTIEDDFSVKLALTAEAEMSDARYSQITSDRSDVSVKIDSMQLSPEMEVTEILGKVVVKGESSRLPIHDILGSFELEAVSDQFEPGFDVDGSFQLDLPLETVDQIDTWNLRGSGQTDTAKFATGGLEDLTASFRMESGIFKLINMNARPIGLETFIEGSSDSQLKANLNWPLLDGQNQDAKIQITGASVPAQWLQQILKHQQKILSGTDSDVSESATGKSVSPVSSPVETEMSGVVNFDAQATTAPGAPEDLKNWNATVEIDDSKIDYFGQSLDELNGRIVLKSGDLSVSQLKGHFLSGGYIDGGLTYSLLNEQWISADLKTTELPADWLLNLVSENQTEIQGLLDQPGWDQIQGNLDGTLSVAVKTVQVQPDIILQAEVVSDRIRFQNLSLNQIRVEGALANQQFTLRKATAQVFDADLMEKQVKRPIPGSISISGNRSSNKRIGD
ncbi:MAG: hypothetical protein AAF939_04430, partial [Planctomycetota bacterium]